MTMINTKKRKRARTVRRVRTGAAAGAVVGLAVAGVAVAARRTEQVLPKLPAPGGIIQVDLASKGIELAVAGRKIHTGPLQGRAAFEIEADRDNPAAMHTKISEFRLASDPGRGDVTVTVEQRAGVGSDASVLWRPSAESPRFHHSLVLVCVITIANPRALGLTVGTGESLTLKASGPVGLSAKPSGFPDDRALYKLRDPAPLSTTESSNGAEASILKFPLKIEGL